MTKHAQKNPLRWQRVVIVLTAFAGAGLMDLGLAAGHGGKSHDGQMFTCPTHRHVDEPAPVGHGDDVVQVSAHEFGRP